MHKIWFLACLTNFDIQNEKSQSKANTHTHKQANAKKHKANPSQFNESKPIQPPNNQINQKNQYRSTSSTFLCYVFNQAKFLARRIALQNKYLAQAFQIPDIVDSCSSGLFCCLCHYKIVLMFLYFFVSREDRGRGSDRWVKYQWDVFKKI